MSPSPQSPPPLASYNTTFYPTPQYLKHYSFVSKNVTQSWIFSFRDISIFFHFYSRRTADLFCAGKVNRLSKVTIYNAMIQWQCEPQTSRSSATAAKNTGAWRNINNLYHFSLLAA